MVATWLRLPSQGSWLASYQQLYISCNVSVRAARYAEIALLIRVGCRIYTCKAHTTESCHYGEVWLAASFSWQQLNCYSTVPKGDDIVGGIRR